MINKFLHVQPSELKFPFKINRPSTCWLQLTNKTDYNVAFKVKTTHPKKYCVRPNVGIICPGSTCVVKVVLQAQKESLLTVPKDKFQVQSMIAPVGMTAEDITSQMFRKDSDELEEQKLRVVFATVDPPSPIPEGSEDDCTPVASGFNRKNYISALFDSASTIAENYQGLLSEGSNYEKESNEENFQVPESIAETTELQDWNMVSKLIDEKSGVVLQNYELQYELEMVRRQIKRNTRSSYVVILVAVFACLLGFLVGYVIK